MAVSCGTYLLKLKREIGFGDVDKSTKLRNCLMNTKTLNKGTYAQPPKVLVTFRHTRAEKLINDLCVLILQ